MDGLVVNFANILFENNINYSKSDLRADNIEGIKEEIQNKTITHIISFIGRTSGIYEGEKITTIDYLEKPNKLKENINDNLYGPLSLALISKENGKHFTYLGTGCIFDKEKENGYKEEDNPNFFGSNYSIVKGFTDSLMKILKK